MNKIEELINEIEKARYSTAEPFTIEIFRTILIKYTCEVAKIDEELYLKADREYFNTNTILFSDQEQINEYYNRLIDKRYSEKEIVVDDEKYCKCTCGNSLEYSNCSKKCERILAEQQPEPTTEQPEPTLQVGWEYRNKKGKWIEITSKDGHSSHPYNSINHGSFTTRGKWSVNESEHTYNLILSTGRPVQKQSSPNWWESLKEGDLVMNHHGDINVVRNWYQEAIGERRVFVEFFEGITTSEHLLRPYTPTPTEAIADLKAGKITEEQFKKVYKG